MPNIIVVALYKFARLPDYREWQSPLLDFCVAHELKGTLLLAPEGINGTVAGTRAGVDALLSLLRADSRFADLEHKESAAQGCASAAGAGHAGAAFAHTLPFGKMKVRLKKEIVTLGVPEVDPSTQVGTYVAPEDWNALLADTEVLLIDTRNDYEYQMGTFRGATDPQTATFREFPDYVRKHLDPAQHKKVALFCTGGIRCEKATSFMLGQGFETVYHLQGGILKYLEKIPAENSLWQGECFVFDERVALGQGLAAPGILNPSLRSPAACMGGGSCASLRLPHLGILPGALVSPEAGCWKQPALVEPFASALPCAAAASGILNPSLRSPAALALPCAAEPSQSHE